MGCNSTRPTRRPQQEFPVESLILPRSALRVPRSESGLDLHAIAEEIDLAVKGFPMKAMADELGKRYTTLANELAEQPGWKLGWADMLRIVRLSGHLEVLDRIEQCFGRVAFALPSPSSNSLPVMQLAARLTREFGEHMEAVAAALEDGVISREEADVCLKELRDVVTACMRLQAYLETVK